MNPAEAARAMNNGLNRNGACTYVPTFWDFSNSFDFDSSPVEKVGLKNIHIIETSPVGTTLYRHLGDLHPIGPFRMLKSYRLPPPLLPIPPIPEEVLKHVEVCFIFFLFN